MNIFFQVDYPNHTLVGEVSVNSLCQQGGLFALSDDVLFFYSNVRCSVRVNRCHHCTVYTHVVAKFIISMSHSVTCSGLIGLLKCSVFWALQHNNGPVSAGQTWVRQGHVGTDSTSSHTLTLLKAFHRGTLHFPYCDAAAYISRAFMWPRVFSIWPYGPKLWTHSARRLISHCPISETQIKGFCLSLVTSKLL